MSFGQIHGHAREINILKRAVLNKRVAHAYLFSGPEGVGKRSVALAFAKALNCGRGGEDSFCDCPDCASVERGVHPNVLVIGPVDKDGVRAENGLIRIFQAREVQDALKYKAERGKKVVILEDADRCMPQAANALLKTLEEPPDDSVLVLVSSKATELLPTILSRCQRINFLPLPDPAVRDFLVEKGLSAGDAEAVSKLSAGSISRAVSLAEGGRHVKRRELVERIHSLGGKDAFEVLKLAEEFSKMDDIEEVLEFLKTWVRDILVYETGVAPLMVNSDMEGFLSESKKAPAKPLDLIDGFYLIERARRDVTPPRYVNKQLAIETLFLELARKRAV